MDSPAPLKICRFCLFDDKDDSRPIGNLFLSFELLPIVKQAEKFLGLQLSPHDSIPPNACQVCIDKIKHVWDFFDSCHNAGERLAEIFGESSSISVASNNKRFSSRSETSETSIDRRIVLKPSKRAVRRKYDSNMGPISLEILEKFIKKHVKFIEDLSYGCIKIEKMIALKRSSSSILNRHKSVSVDKPVFSCSKCKKTFTNKLKLLTHEGTHKQPCGICRRMIKPKKMESHLIMHASRFEKKLQTMKKHKEVKISCEICLKEFKTKMYLNKHKAKVHKVGFQQKPKKMDKIKIKIKPKAMQTKRKELLNCDVENKEIKPNQIQNTLETQREQNGAIITKDLKQNQISDYTVNVFPSVDSKVNCDQNPTNFTQKQRQEKTISRLSSSENLIV